MITGLIRGVYKIIKAFPVNKEQRKDEGEKEFYDYYLAVMNESPIKRRDLVMIEDETKFIHTHYRLYDKKPLAIETIYVFYKEEGKEIDRHYDTLIEGDIFGVDEKGKVIKEKPIFI